MNTENDSYSFWQQVGRPSITDEQFDRGARRPDKLIKAAESELISFIGPNQFDEVLDAGCGTGRMLQVLSPLVSGATGIDFSEQAVQRARQRLANAGTRNVTVSRSSVVETSIPSGSKTLVICLSVLHYLNDAAVHAALQEFRRVLKPNGRLVLHVKNLASLYGLTLIPVKHIKHMLFPGTFRDHYRTPSWYFKALDRAGFSVVDYNSFNKLTVDILPAALASYLQYLEFSLMHTWPFSTRLVRSLGADMKIAAVTKS